MKSNKNVYNWALNSLAMIAVVFSLYRIEILKSNQLSQPLQRGSTVALQGEDWSANRQTLVMAVQAGCPWCKASAAFYRDILHSSSSNTFHVLAISPQSVQDTQAYLRSLGVYVADLRQVDFGNLGVQATPTLVLVNERGRIRSTWVGKLSPELEREVFKALGVHRAWSEDKSVDE